MTVWKRNEFIRMEAFPSPLGTSRLSAHIASKVQLRSATEGGRPCINAFHSLITLDSSLFSGLQVLSSIRSEKVWR